MAAGGIAILLVIVMNRNHSVDVWFFGRFEKTNVLWVMLVSGASAVVIAWTLSRLRQVIRDVQEMNRAKVLQAAQDEQKRLADELKEQEGRIDEKIQKAISAPGDSDESPEDA